jgi:hypothetical protein
MFLKVEGSGGMASQNRPFLPGGQIVAVKTHLPKVDSSCICNVQIVFKLHWFV